MSDMTVCVCVLLRNQTRHLTRPTTTDSASPARSRRPPSISRLIHVAHPLTASSNAVCLMGSRHLWGFERVAPSLCERGLQNQPIVGPLPAAAHVAV